MVHLDIVHERKLVEGQQQNENNVVHVRQLELHQELGSHKTCYFGHYVFPYYLQWLPRKYFVKPENKLLPFNFLNSIQFRKYFEIFHEHSVEEYDDFKIVNIN